MTVATSSTDTRRRFVIPRCTFRDPTALLVAMTHMSDVATA